MNTPSLIFRQLFEATSCTYTYIVGCPVTKAAAIIDPVLETVERDAQLVKELGLDLRFGVNTHVHADHVTGNHKLAQIFPSMKAVLSDKAGAKADVFLGHKGLLDVGKLRLECRHTPGHTNGCATFVLHKEKMLFSGDALLVRGCGRTDFQQGCASRLYNVIHEEIFTLPDDFIVFPGHDYHGQTATSVGEEKKFNPRLTLKEDLFVELMKNLNLDHPKQIDRALPANMKNGQMCTKCG